MRPARTYVRRYPAATVLPVEQCHARIKERTLTLEQRLRGTWYHDLPTSEDRCSRSADGDVCGIPLCDQHRRMVTQWIDGQEELSPRAARLFERWGVAPSTPFIGEHDLYPWPATDPA
jgi:hypothetical protein